MDYEIVGLCETGLKRKTNQDAVFWAKNSEAAICMVADGMGGHEHGEIASNLIRQTVAAYWDGFCLDHTPKALRVILETIRCELQKANKTLYQKYGKTSVCGSTLVLLLCYLDQYGIICAGDSRVYRKKGFSFRQITVDDVWENQSGLSEELRTDLSHPNRGKLVNAFGADLDLRVRVVTNELAGGEIFLICSDGLYKMCPEKRIKAAMGKARKGGDHMKLALLDLKAKIEAAGARDNFSIIMLRTKKE